MTREGHKSYWGSYDWPFEEYKRFDHVAGLEHAADETPLMKTAFSFLSKVQELALSIDSGLGWLNGPDMSLRSSILRRPSPVFGSSRAIPERKVQAQGELWKHLERRHSRDGAALQHAALFRQDTDSFYSELSQQALQTIVPRGHGSHDLAYLDVDLVAGALTPESSIRRPRSFLEIIGASDSMDDVEDFPPSPNYIPDQGVVYTTADVSNAERFTGSSIIPHRLSRSQREWLLETEWAQRAFLSSYMVAVMDNPSTFRNVHTLNLARLSSRYIMSLCRSDFWNALPALKTVIIHVIADWRDVVKDQAGFVETPSVEPSCALGYFQKLLSEMIVTRENVKTLQIGWAGGGEQADGLHARNKHILPAPVLPEEWLNSTMADDSQLASRMVSFPHVEHLTLSNCWLTPYALQSLIGNASHMRRLTLDSVSITAVPRVVPNAGPIFAGNPAVPAFAHALLQHHVQTAQAPPPHAQGAVQAVANLPAAWNAAPPPVAAAPAAAAQSQVNREGSWPVIIRNAFPRGPAADGNATAPAPDTRRGPREMELASCGYARIASPRIDQSAVEPPQQQARDAYFGRRYGALIPFMMASRDPLLGEIVQYMPEHEQGVLRDVWGMAIGWGDDERAQAAEFDGLLRGGTGRFSGVVRREERGAGLAG